jgi:hypothetical protein
MDTETNLEAEALEVEALPEAEVEAAPELDDDGNPIEEPTEAEPEVELADIDIEGKTYKLPAELKDKFLMQADYTRKTQELAEQRKAVEATLQQVNEVSQAEQLAMVAVGVIDTQLADFNTIDWDAWEQSDPQSAHSAWRQYQQLKEQRQNAVIHYSQAQQHRTLMTQQETARLLEHGQRELATKIPGWGQEKATALQSHAIEAYGFTPADLATVADPRMVQVLHDAWQYRQANKTQQVASKVQAQQAIKPAAKIATGKAPVRPLDDRASTDAWMKARQAQLSK